MTILRRWDSWAGTATVASVFGFVAAYVNFSLGAFAVVTADGDDALWAWANVFNWISGAELLLVVACLFGAWRAEFQGRPLVSRRYAFALVAAPFLVPVLIAVWIWSA